MNKYILTGRNKIWNKCSLFKIAGRKLLSETNKNNLSANEKLREIIKEEAEESVQEKYKDFIKTNKKEEANRRRLDYETNKFIKTSKIPLTDYSKVILQRNFLFTKGKKFDKKEDKKEDDSKINLEFLNKLEAGTDIPPLALYEIDARTVESYQRMHTNMKLYLFLSLLFNSGFIFSFQLLFYKTPFIYGLCYVTNTLTLITLLLNKQIKYHVLSIDYLHNEMRVKITRWNFLTMNTNEKTYHVQDLEMTFSNKILEKGVVLRNNKNKDKMVVGELNEGIWHNKELFEDLFGKIKL